ncbi:MAG: zinc-binding dehydrogenase [Streptosporangiaceae bacterium]
MKALTSTRTPDGARYTLAEVPEPTAGPADLLVEVHASAINQADLRHARTHFAASERESGPAIAGLEMAGVVIALGERVTGFAVGDRVMAMTGRAWAERATVDYRLAVPVPDGFSWSQAAATPVSYITAHDCVTSAARLAHGESVLVQGATTAAGLAVLQVARQAGAQPILGTTSSPAKAERLRSAGCDIPVVRGSVDVADRVAAATDGHGADVVVDILGGTALMENVAAAAIQGRIICLGRVSGPRGELDLDEFARKRIRMTGVTFRTRSFEERCEVVARFVREMLPALDSRQIRPAWDRSFDWADCAEAETFLRGGTQFGKVLLSVKDGDRAEAPS